ncbi:MAG: NAD/NADP octopine/nopaline dehydrogenase family protein [Desulfobacterales bacterium]|nr:MAG: NAD/NADP octopine/nopaline dehydrogenase family protein [Desulfobacterales bacterium]
MPEPNHDWPDGLRKNWAAADRSCHPPRQLRLNAAIKCLELEVFSLLWYLFFEIVESGGGIMIMQQALNYAVLGSGNGGRAFCAQIAAKGSPVVMYEPLEETADYLRLRAEKEMFLEGDIQTGGSLRGVTMDMHEAVGDADVILIVVPSFAHPPLFQKLIPQLKDGQHVVIVPGNYGGLLLKKMMADARAPVNISISETATLPYACRISAYNTVTIHKKKSQIKIATSPRANNPFSVAVMNAVFGGFIRYLPGGNPLAMGLDNINQILHPLPVLLNYGAIEKNPETFRHYMDGVTPLISEKMMQMDEERLAIGRAFGLDLMSTLDQLKMYYGKNDAQTYHEYVNSPESPYRDIVGHNVRSRYLTEDVPGLHVPAVQLAQRAGVTVPLMELCVQLTSALHDVDYASQGTTLAKLGIADKKPEEIIALSA